jgi:exodeoxyribonuclease V gamma subunit
MIHLHYSNRLEELIDPLARRLSAQQRDDPLRRAVIIVPNRIIEEFLKLRLAGINGVAANIEFPFLRRYLARLIAAADPSAALLEADELELVIFECLRTALAASEPELKAVADYVASGSRRPADREMRLFELSARTAYLFREYSISRARMLALWRQGTAPELPTMRETERWQRYLFRSIFGPGGRLLQRWINGEQRFYFLLNPMLEALAQDQLRSALATPLHIFGLSYAGPEFVRAFARIGSMTELHIYALNPCMEFWEDADSSYAGIREALARRGHKLGAIVESGEDPFGLDNTNDNLALAWWGKPGREYIRLLNELTDCDFDAHFKHVVNDGEAPALLGRIQEAILRRQPHSLTAEAASAAADESLRFLACPGIRREVEVVADSIWSLIRDDSKTAHPQRLRFHQIALLIPDAQLSAYLPQIEPVFAQRYQIPVNLLDRPLGAEANVVEAVQLLLEFPKGRFDRDTVLHLLTHPAIAGETTVDPAQWDQWCRAAGVFFGADGSEMADTYIPPNFFHWDQGLRRLALGVFMGEAQETTATTILGADGNDYLPCETAQDELPSLASLIAGTRQLLAQALDLRDRTFPISMWARLLGEFVRTYVKPAELEGQMAAEYCAGAIESMGPEELRGEPVGYEIACARALARIQAAQSEQGRYAEGGVAVGSFSSLRSIPFRVIFALGMGENMFPQRERRDLLDLRMASRRAGDVSPSQRDRYLFLETLLAARERFIMSWVSRDALTGQKLEPSPLLRELQAIARAWLSEPEIQKLTITHPRNTYDPDYFPVPAGKQADRELLTFDRHAPNAARMLALRSNLAKSCGPAVSREELTLEMFSTPVQAQLAPALRVVHAHVLNSESPEQRGAIHLSLAALRKYLECPLQGAAQYALGMLDDDDGDDDDAQDEPLSQTMLDTILLLRDAFWAGRGQIEDACREVEQLLRIHQLAGQAPVGPFARAISEGLFARLRLCVEQAGTLGIGKLEGWQRIRIGGAAEQADQADCIVDAVLLDVPMRRSSASTNLRIALRGTVAVSARRDKSINCVARKDGAKPYHFLGGLLGAIALAAAGETRARRFDSIVLGASDGSADADQLTRSFKMLSGDEARTYLTDLVEDIFSGKNNHFLPIDAIAKIIQDKIKDGHWPRPRQMIDAVEYFRENDMVPCRSNYGPIRNPRDYPVPPAAEIKKIIKRRFGPIMTIFGAGA